MPIKVTQWHRLVKRPNLQLNFLTALLGPRALFSDKVFHTLRDELNTYEKIVFAPLRRIYSGVELMFCPRPRHESASRSGEENVGPWASKKANGQPIGKTIRSGPEEKDLILKGLFLL